MIIGRGSSSDLWPSPFKGHALSPLCITLSLILVASRLLPCRMKTNYFQASNLGASQGEGIEMALRASFACVIASITAATVGREKKV